MRALLLLPLVLACFGCSSAAEPAARSCPTGLVAVGEACVPAKDDCGPLAAPALAGGCVPVGVPADACGEGFVADGLGACVVVLPKAACPKGQLAVPGETSCHPVASCGDAPFPAVADEGKTRFVDQKAEAGGDGSRARPFQTISAAVLAAPVGGTVAVTDGLYAEDLVLRTAVTLVGRCPERVEVRGQGAPFALEVTDRSTIRGLAITGPRTAIGAFWKDVTLDRLWLHDNLEGAVWSEDGESPASFTLTDALLEDNAQFGVRTFAASALIERVVVRNTRATAEHTGAGLVLLGNDVPTRHGGAFTVRRSVVTASHTAGITLLGGQLTLEGSLVRAISPSPKTPGFATGLSISKDYDWSLPAEATVSTSVIEEIDGMGIAVDGATLAAEHVTIRDLHETKSGAHGVFASDGAEVTFLRSVVRRAVGIGLVGLGSSMHVERSLIDDTRADASVAIHGIGLEVAWDRTDVPASTLASSVISGAHAFGVYVYGAELDVADTALRAIVPDVDGQYGDGATVMSMVTDDAVVHRGKLKARGLWVTNAARAAVTVFGADVSLDHTRSECNGFDYGLVNQGLVASGGATDLRVDLDDRGGNVCGCGANLKTCTAQPAAFEPVAAN